MNIKRIKDTRIDNDFTQEYMAKHLNIPQRTYSSWENEEVKVSLKNMIKICKFLNISIDYAVGLSSSPIRIYDVTELNLKIIAKNILKIREIKNLSQKELAIILNYSKSMLSGIEHGKVIISLERLYLLAKRYVFSIDELCYKCIEK